MSDKLEKKIMDYIETTAKAISTCVRKNRQVGAIVIQKHTLECYPGIKVSVNKNPGELGDCGNICPRRNLDSGKGINMCKVLHAEIEAILFCMEDNELPLDNYILFTTLFPCNACAMFIMRSGIKEIIYRHDYNPESMSYVKQHLDEAGISYTKM